MPARGTDPGIRARWFKLAGEPLEALDPKLGVTEAVLEQVWRLPRSESDFGEHEGAPAPRPTQSRRPVNEEAADLEDLPF